MVYIQSVIKFIFVENFYYKIMNNKKFPIKEHQKKELYLLLKNKLKRIF
jgi:hypothetical protein